VGTSLDYFEKLGLAAGEGTLPLRLGDAVVGAQVAEELGIRPGARLMTDVTKLYDISASYPVRLRVTGVLRESGTPDDRAIFVDMKTGWVILGIGHGHVETAKAGDMPRGIIERKDGEVVFDDSIVKYIEITDENIASFHFHGDPKDFPVSAVLVWAVDSKSSSILQGRYGVSKTVQMLVPRKVITELMGFVFRIKRFFDANFALVAVATSLFLTLIVLLSLRIRRREMETLFKIGCSRFTVFRLQALELTIVLAAGVLLSGILSGAAFWYVVRMHLV
jgi:putative ABC transport system permease protein